MKELYRQLGASGRFYWNIKNRIFPVKKLLAAIPQSSSIVDLGCGNGLFSLLLARFSPQAEIIGIDIDAAKVQAACKMAAANPLLHFIQGDLASFDIPAAGVYLLVDVLYLLPWDLQERIIANIAGQLQPGQTLLIKEMDKKPAWKYAWNYLQECLAVRLLRFTFGGAFYFRSTAQWLELLAKHGLDAECQPLDRGYAYPHMLLKAQKKAASSVSAPP